MTITQAAWYKKTCKTIIYSAASLSFLIFPLFKQRHVGEPAHSSASAHCQDSFSHKYLTAVVLFQLEQTRNGLGQSEGLDCGGGELSEWEERKQTSIQGPDTQSEVSCRDTALCSSNAITSKLCTAPRVPQPARKDGTGGSRAAGRRGIMILIALPRCLKGR